MKEESKELIYTVHGRKMYFSKKEIEEILEWHIPKERILPETFEVAEKPTDGRCFKVELGKIIPKYFLKERSGEQQEWTRKIILEALSEALKRTEQYDVFYLLIPEKKWVYGEKEYITVDEAMDFSKEVGGYTTTWIEKALGWAQRISNDNGSDEVWEEVCNDADTIKWYRLIVWKDGKLRLVGGASVKLGSSPASGVYDFNYNPNHELDYAVPSVVLKKLHCPLSNC